MAKRPFILLFALLLFRAASPFSSAQTTPHGICSAFAPDGTLATATGRNGDLELKITDPESKVVLDEVQQLPGALAKKCEQAFSPDSKWLVTVVYANELTVFVYNLEARRLQKKFSSPWFGFETGYGSTFLAGFLPDDSLVLVRYVRQNVADHSDASHIKLHLESWSVNGELLSDREIGDDYYGRQPVFFSDLDLLWIQDNCGTTICETGWTISKTGITKEGSFQLPGDYHAPAVALPEKDDVLYIYGEAKQKASLLDPSGHVESEISLPFTPNLLRPLVPDWYYAKQPAISADAGIAAVPRHHVAWVLVDTDRDWGSDIVVLRLHPLKVIARLKTGQGGLGAVSVAHSDGIIRLVGFWHGKWHQLQCKEDDSAECKFKE
ncbi:MAG TPA: hypothetical protein VE783_06845 [Candidatus Limnocylindrales bacterium]|nr:hypothetical protein [Candidatus Limnocylindrales bacterium]